MHEGLRMSELHVLVECLVYDARHVGNNRFRESFLFQEFRDLVLIGAAEFPEVDERFGLRVRLREREHVGKRGHGKSVSTDADGK